MFTAHIWPLSAAVSSHYYVVHHYIEYCYTVHCTVVTVLLGTEHPGAEELSGCTTKGAIKSTEAMCLTLPGKMLHLTALFTAKKINNRGTKEGALQALRRLESEGLRQLYEVGSSHCENIVRHASYTACVCTNSTHSAHSV